MSARLAISDRAPEARVLDPERALPAVQSLPVLRQFAIRELRPVGSWIKPGRYFNVVHRAYDESGYARGDVAVGLATPDLMRRIVRLQDRPCRQDEQCAHCSVVATEGGLFAHSYPLDLRLPKLRLAVRRSSLSRTLGPTLSVVQLTLKSWRPGMRCTLEAEFADGRRGFVKLTAQRDLAALCERLRRAHHAVANDDRLELPEVRACLPGAQLYVLGACRGRAIADMATDDADDVAADVLSAFQSLAVDGIERIHRTDDELTLLKTWLDFLTRLQHRRLPVFARVFEALQMDAPRSERPPVVVHRDFYDKQVLAYANGASLVDLDTFCRGDAELDAGNFLAHRTLRRVQGRGDGTRGHTNGRFVARLAGRVDPSTVRWYVRATLLRLAAMYSVRPDGEDVWGPCLDEVQSV